jgi:hypothetical protein
MGLGWGPHDSLHAEIVERVDELAAVATADDFDALRSRYTNDDTVRVPADITSFIDGEPVAVHLEL